MRGGLAFLISFVLAGAGCNAAAPSSTPAATTTPAPSQAAWPPGAPDALLLVGTSGDPGVRVIVASTGESLLNLPLGAVARSDFGRAFVATVDGGRTRIRDVVVQPDLEGPELVIDGSWRLPTVGYDPMPVGVSADGSTLALIEDVPAPTNSVSPVSRFAVVRAVPLEGPPQRVELPGEWSYDAISPNGEVLYLVEHLDGDSGHYQVRAIDLPSGTMRPSPITDKRNIGEAMSGWPIAQLRAPTGMVYTLYRGMDHPFIHALNTTDGWAVCIDLPAVAGAAGDDAAADWGLAASADWSRLYAANTALGRISEVNAADYTVRRTVSMGSVAAAPTAILAKFGHQESGPVARRLVLTPDGATAFAAGPDGIVALETKDLSVRARWLGGSSVEGLGLTPDGQMLFALLAGGRIVAIDARTGRVFGQVPGTGYDRLLGVVPW